MKEGLFITIEGVEGAGKTDSITGLKKYFEDSGRKVVVTTELRNSEFAENVRHLIMGYEIDVETEASLFAAARRVHLKNVIIPALKKGYVVICDRFVDSSYAYQSGEGLKNFELVEEMNKWVIGKWMPDVTLFLDLLPEIGLKRISDNQRETNRLDLKPLSYHENIRENYLSLIKREGAKCGNSRFKVVNADQAREKVLNDMITMIKEAI